MVIQLIAMHLLILMVIFTTVIVIIIVIIIIIIIEGISEAIECIPPLDNTSMGQISNLPQV
jgi:predicted PurR-regulated permease PerM